MSINLSYSQPQLRQKGGKAYLYWAFALLRKPIQALVESIINMKVIFWTLLLLTLCVDESFGQNHPDKSRVFVLTDISNEPDDEESLVRFLVYANEYDIEGLVATTSTWLRTHPREDLIRRQIYAYDLVRDNLLKHKSGFPQKEQLLAVAATGQTGYGMEDVGEGKTSIGSKLLENAVDCQDDRPLWISIWGGANTLAQTLFDVRKERSPAALQAFISKIRVYTISDQDDAGPWIRKEFPELFYIVSPSNPGAQEYHWATWTGISGDKDYRNGPGYHFHLVDNPWLEENIMRNHGPLGNLYPRLAYIMEGDTPSFFGLIRNGLGWHLSPANGGWGGRYQLYRAYGESRPIWTNNRSTRDCITLNDKLHCSDQATIWRWRQHYQHDFAARMDWCVASTYSEANHNPVAILNSDTSKAVIKINGGIGSVVKLNAQHSYDPDGDVINIHWFIYKEAGTPGTEATLSSDSDQIINVEIEAKSKPGDVHIILQLEDQGAPSLFSYRRAIIQVSE